MKTYMPNFLTVLGCRHAYIHNFSKSCNNHVFNDDFSFEILYTLIIHFQLQLEPSQECKNAVQKMNSCPACQGYTELKPCGSYCINVMKGCLVWHIELQKLWDQYLEALSELTERLQKPYNLGKEIY